MGKLINNLRKIYNSSLHGGLVITGNSCVAIGDVNNKVREFLTPSGEYTTNWSEIGSTAYLEIPSKSSIKYAILEWHSAIRKDDNIEHYSPITFKTPSGSFKVSIDILSSDEAFFEDSYKISSKWVDVTNLVKKSGDYTVVGIPINIPEKEVKDLRDHDKAPGWSLSVVYENENMPFRSISIYMGIKNCSYNTLRLNNFIELDGFNISNIPKKAFLTFVASNGDPNMYCGVNLFDKIKDLNDIEKKTFIGNELDSSYENQETGSIMPHDNVFSGTIMNTNTESQGFGEIDTRGTLGEKNNFPFNVLNQHDFKGNRGKLDVVSFDISDKIVQYQNKIILSPYMDFLPPNVVNIVACGLQIDVDNSIIENDIVKVFDEKIKGGIINIGNTCAVIGDVNNKIKEFITPKGDFTIDCNEIGSSAYLEIPKDSNIKFAVLEWHSTVENRNERLDIEEEYSEITFTTPKRAKKLSIKVKDKNQAFYKDSFSNNKESVKWIDVTDLVKEDGEGFYTVKGIKTLILKDSDGNIENHDMSIGWSLNVIYENDNNPLRKVSFYIGIKNQSYDIKKMERVITIEINTNEFKENKKAYLSLVVCNGNPNMYSGINIYNDISLIDNLDKKYYLGSILGAENAETVEYLGGIIPYNNAFSGIIMNTNIESTNYGKIETRGTLGNENNKSFGILNQANFKGNRGKIDILSFDMSTKIQQNQKKLILAFDLHKNPSDSLNVICLGIQIDL